jgi:predicted small lipoprotein YifL
MKKIISALLTIGLILSLCACGDKKENDDNKSASSAKSESSESATSSEKNTESGSNAETEKTEPTVTKEVTTTPEVLDIFPEGVTYTEEYTNVGDPGDNLSPAEAALTAVDFFSEHFYFLGDTDITFFDLDSVDGEECYLYNVKDETGGTSVCAVNYATGEIYLYLEESGEYQSVNEMYDNSDVTDNSGDTDVLNWAGEYVGDGFSILINNFNGESFRFAISNLRNGEYIFEGVAVIDPDDNNMATYADCGFYLYEDMEHIDFLTSESGEWSHLRGQYTQI